MFQVRITRPFRSPFPMGIPTGCCPSPHEGKCGTRGGEATHPSDASTEGRGGGKQGPTELSSSNWKTPGHKASPEPTLTPSQCSSTCSVLSLLPTSLPPCLGSPVPTDHPALSLAASRRALGLSNSCYIFCSNVHVTEERTEASFPPSPQGFIATNSFSFLSLRSCLHPSLLPLRQGTRSLWRAGPQRQVLPCNTGKGDIAENDPGYETWDRNFLSLTEETGSESADLRAWETLERRNLSCEEASLPINSRGSPDSQQSLGIAFPSAVNPTRR